MFCLSLERRVIKRKIFQTGYNGKLTAHIENCTNRKNFWHAMPYGVFCRKWITIETFVALKSHKSFTWTPEQHNIVLCSQENKCGLTGIEQTRFHSTFCWARWFYPSFMFWITIEVIRKINLKKIKLLLQYNENTWRACKIAVITNWIAFIDYLQL